MKLQGAFTALVTPFKNGVLDEEAYREFIEWQITEGIDGLVPCGTTGESATLSHEEHEKVIRICVEQAKGRVPVIAGAGSNNTAEAIDLAKASKAAGADAILLITPYYNKPTQEGLMAHFKAVAQAVQMVKDGEGDFLMKGLCSTDKFLRAILNKETGLLPPKGTLTHCAVFEIPSYHKLLFRID